MYAILDIETTGGKYNEEGITEIAVYKFDGHRVVDKFISLVNPEREIQAFVVNLTGINNNMLKSAPKFYEIAKRIVEITEDCIIVAHNAQFDYRILRTEFKRLGYDYKRKSLCTVELAQKLIPGKDSYSLGKLVRSLGIPVSDRHRANGDAMATVKLFKMLIDKDTEKMIIKEAVKNDIEQKMAKRLLDIIEQLPSSTGVYYIHNKKGEIIYIGKSKNIRRRINQHFTSTSSKARRLRKEVVAVTYEETGNELIALLKENQEIKDNQPVHNRSRKRNVFNLALSKYQDENGYLNLKIDKASRTKDPVTTFTNIHEAKNTLYKIAEEFSLCHKLLRLSDAREHCFNYSVNKCNGACVAEEEPFTYNKRTEEALKKYSYPQSNMVIIDKGREIDERSAVLIEDGEFKGISYFNLNYQINNLNILKNIITPMNNNPDATHIIQSYLRKRKVLKVISFENQH
ncbi:GIY-YIG nuclease family protein [Leptobacterium flavescens]|uniref:GIY-YIG nuclease family protein n=1 Tax=Leptobacterium flavescens TaxID=472055 RepID=A0A6P0ULC2_9FLAO|nr:exonuclease domain-containing protein [Leptobacterium flavescens]NER13322.1 GIY-YIG nuclease family protein [Leptobacterium flavescens]